MKADRKKWAKGSPKNAYTNQSVDKMIEELRRRLSELPAGYISRKIINGKERFYRQWREGQKLRSKYIKASELELVKTGIAERKRLEVELKNFQEQKALLQRRDNEHILLNPNTQLLAAEEFAPYNAGPSTKSYLYLKWGNKVIGTIDEAYNVSFLEPEFNRVVSMYTAGRSTWSREEFTAFLRERIPGRDRRDIEQILFKCGINHYDVLDISLATRAVNAKDLIWIAKKKNERFDDAVTEVFDSVFGRKKDLEGDSVDTPEGYNIKRYGVFNNKYGIYKRRINPLSTDVESEVAVYKIAELLGVDCCPCYRVDEDTVFSEFLYNFAKEYIVHFRRIIREPRGEDEFMNLVAVRPQYFAKFAKIIALDFLTRQDDRHLSNIAVKIIDSGLGDGRKSREEVAQESVEEIYPLYDNGRSLFYEDTEDTVNCAVKDIATFATAFGPKGTYFDHIKTIKSMGVDFDRLLNLDGLTKKNLKEILKGAGFSGYRLDGALEWIIKCKEILQSPL